MYKVFCLLITLNKEELLIINIIYHYWSAWKKKLPKNGPKWRRKSALSPKQWTMSQSITTRAKLHELHFELLLNPPYSPDLALSDYWLLADLKRTNREKRFGSSKEVILEIEGYFESKDTLFYKKGIEFLEKRWNQWSPRRRWFWWTVEFCLKVVLLVRPGTYWVICSIYKILSHLFNYSKFNILLGSIWALSWFKKNILNDLFIHSHTHTHIFRKFNKRKENLSGLKIF